MASKTENRKSTLGKTNPKRTILNESVLSSLVEDANKDLLNEDIVFKNPIPRQGEIQCLKFAKIDSQTKEISNQVNILNLGSSLTDLTKEINKVFATEKECKAQNINKFISKFCADKKIKDENSNKLIILCMPTIKRANHFKNGFHYYFVKAVMVWQVGFEDSKFEVNESFLVLENYKRQFININRKNGFLINVQLGKIKHNFESKTNISFYHYYFSDELEPSMIDKVKEKLHEEEVIDNMNTEDIPNNDEDDDLSIYLGASKINKHKEKKYEKKPINDDDLKAYL
jgi:hypothetical protein